MSTREQMDQDQIDRCGKLMLELVDVVNRTRMQQPDLTNSAILSALLGALATGIGCTVKNRADLMGYCDYADEHLREMVVEQFEELRRLERAN